MHTSIIRATKTHYAALQHRPGDGRIGLRYSVSSPFETLTCGTIWVKASNEGRKKMEMSKLENRLFAMYPFEAARVDIEVWEKT